MKVPLLELGRQHAALDDAIREAIDRVLTSQRFIGGPEVARFERRFAELLGVRHAIGVSSGTDALYAALRALDLAPGDEVITSDYTFFAPVGCLLRLGLTPVLVDIDPTSFNLDPTAVEAAIGPRTRAILPVHLFGQCADMTALTAIAEDRRLAVIEDAAQAVGARHAGRHAGTFGEVGCFSFFPSKNLGGIGDGGMVVTDDDATAERLRMICHHGARPKYVHHTAGGNFRLDAIQAAVLDAKLDHLGRWTDARRAHARRYRDELRGVGRLVLPESNEDNLHVFNQFCVRVPSFAGGSAHARDGLREGLADDGVETGLYYPLPLHRQPALAGLGLRDEDFPHATEASATSLALPVFPELTDEEQGWVIARLRERLDG